MASYITWVEIHRPQLDQLGNRRICCGVNIIRNLSSAAWESFAIRVVILGLVIGAAPFYLLSLAVASLGA